MAQPILRTERLVMVPLADRHLELEVELDADPEVLRYLWGRARSREEVTASHAERMALSIGRLGFWVAFTAEDDFVGLMMLPPVQPGDLSTAELGYRLARRFWRQGLASEASRALLRHAFDTVGLDRVIARTMAVNAGSRGVMQAVGLRYVRTFFPTWDDPLPDSDKGEVEYEMTREMWKQRAGWRCAPVAAADAESLIPLLHDAEGDDDRIRAALRDPAGQGYLAQVEGKPVGAAVMRWSSEEPSELLYLAVAADTRRQGHGRRIVAALQAELPRHGRTMLVGTANCALDNIAFYQRCGFRMSAVRRDFFAYIDPPLTENGIVMRDMIVFSYERDDR